MTILSSWSFVIPAASLITGFGAIIVKSILKSIHLRLTRTGDLDVSMSTPQIPGFTVWIYLTNLCFSFSIQNIPSAQIWAPSRIAMCISSGLTDKNSLRATRFTSLTDFRFWTQSAHMMLTVFSIITGRSIIGFAHMTQEWDILLFVQQINPNLDDHGVLL